MILADLVELKTLLDIPNGDTSQDAKLMYLVAMASNVIEEYLGRQNQLFKKSRTEYYNGTNTQKLLLRSRPTFTTPTIQVWADNSGDWGSGTDPFSSSTELVYGTDFALQIDQDDGTSRSGILVRLNTVWNRPTVRQTGYLFPFVYEGQGNIKVTYTGGYTIDSLPDGFRLATNILVMRLRALMPFGWQITSESYEERSISLNVPTEDLFSIIKPFLFSYKNWKW